ncbi:hypothetical protein [Streptomyces sp. V3I7]|uniref:hypothetical protein n=1 Tax=Streptomyces sp. V3I7 TaxID=3042278 RepID=UPI0027824B79|nr:hypothetical protein [Streptomyces sp. V3I7]MDQ0991968.1 ABC-type Mn2+/Zn2+ transport system permease subunit [Streptomyces sp. V3I7]
MAQAAPVSGAAPGTHRRARTPDVFDTRTHARARVAVPVGLGLIYGYWAAANQRSGGPITGWNLLLGFVTAFVFALVCWALLEVGPHVRREVHAVAWSAFAGIAFGFLFAQTGAPLLRVSGTALVIAVAFFLVLFYWYYTHEDAEGRRTG